MQGGHPQGLSTAEEPRSGLTRLAGGGESGRFFGGCYWSSNRLVRIVLVNLPTSLMFPSFTQPF